jgi:3D (Asp-Asp-Asp) domain-containing protein
VIALLAKAAVITASVTAYSPCSSGSVMANGEHTHWGSVAVNGLRLGTRIRFRHPVRGRRVFTVRDRGGMRGHLDVDVFMPSCSAAVRFGRHRRAYAVVG